MWFTYFNFAGNIFDLVFISLIFSSFLRDQERQKAEQERERLEKLRGAEQERLEKLRGAEQAVDKHFEESLRPQRLAQHKVPTLNHRG